MNTTIKKGLRIGAYVLGGILLLLVLAIGGAVAWLHTSHAEKTIAGLVTKAAESQGVTLGMGEFTGPLPGRLFIRDITAADKKGVFFKAEQLEVTVRLSALLTKTVEITLARLDAPVVARLPELPPSPPQPEKTQSSSGFSLPIAIKVDEVILDRGEVLPPVLYGANAPGGAAPVRLGLSGNAGISGSALSSALEVIVSHPGSEYDVFLRLGDAPEPEHKLFGDTASGAWSDPGPPSPDRLTLRVRARDNVGGLLSRLTGNPDLPAYALDIDGTGSFARWTMRLAAVAGEKAVTRIEGATDGVAAGENALRDAAAFITEENRLAAVTGTLGLAATGNKTGLDGLMSALWKADLAATLTPGARSPAQARVLAGPEVTVTSSIAADLGKGDGKRIDVGKTVIKGSSWQAGLEKGQLGIPAGSGATTFAASLLAAVTDAAKLADCLDMTRPGITTAEVRADVSGSAGTGKGGLAETTVAVLGRASANAQEETYTLDYSIDAGLAGTTAALRRFTVNGLGIVLEATAQSDTRTGAASAKASLVAGDGARWQDLVASLAGQRIGGGLNADLDAALTADKKAHGTLTLKGRDMRWPSEQLQNLLGPTLEVDATVTGGGNAPYVADLGKVAAAAVTASGHAEYDPDEGSPPSSRIKATLKASLTDTGLLASGAAGPVNLEAEASGTVGAPVFDVTVNSPRITTPQGAFTDIRASLAGKATVGVNGNATTVAGKTMVNVASSPGGALNLDADFAAATEPGGATSGSVSNLAVTMDGLALKADMKGVMPAGAKAAPQLSGTASLQVADWNALARLTGQKIQGEKAGLEATLSSEGGRQDALVRLNAGSLAMAGETDNVFAVKDVTGSIEATDIFKDPQFLVDIATGKSSAGPLDWETGTIKAQSEGGEGGFNIALRVDPPSREEARKARTVNTISVRTTSRAQRRAAFAAMKAIPGRPDRNERLTLAGSFTQKPLQVTIDRFAARLPSSPLGFYLTKPATISLARGIEVKDMQMNILPGGNLACEAALVGQKGDVEATISELPLALVRFFAPDAPVPDGSVSARVALVKNGASIGGNANMIAVVTPTTPPGGNQAPQPVVFSLQSSLEKSPDPRFPFLRAVPGVTRLRGDMAFGQAGGAVSAQAMTAFVSAPGGASPSGTASGAAANGLPAPALYFDLPLRFAANGIPSPAAAIPMAASLNWEGAITPIWQALPMPDRSLDGVAKANATVSGTMENPVYNAAVYLAGGRFEDRILGVLLQDMELELTSATRADTKLLFRASDGTDGTVALEGLLSAAPIAAPRRAASLVKDVQIKDSEGNITTVSKDSVEKGKAPSGGPHLSARGQINHLKPLHRDDLALTLSGRVSVNGPLIAPVVEAAVEVERGEVTLLSSLTSGVRSLDIANEDDKDKEQTDGGSCLIDISIPNRFYIRGRGLDCEWSGKLHIVGPLASPSLVGSLSPVRGSFDLLSRPFAFSGGEISFFGGDRIDPGLSLELTYDGPDITAIVRATGRASKPQIAMESRPPLPQDQIMSQVLFGKDFSKLSRFEALQVANSVRQLANIGEGGFDPLTTMRKTLGIDMLRVGSSSDTGVAAGRSESGAPDAATVGGAAAGSSSGGDDQAATPTVEAGKYINDAIYVGVEQGATSDSTGVRVEVELMPNLTLQGKTTSRSSSVGLGWKKDY